MKTIIAALTLSAALVAVSAFDASAQTTPTNRERAQQATPIPSCKDMDKKSQAYKDCMAERKKANATSKKQKSS
jgi:hypothetical protein